MSNSYRNSEPSVPAALSAIYDLLASLVRGAPTFIYQSGVFPERNIDSEFRVLIEG